MGKNERERDRSHPLGKLCAVYAPSLSAKRGIEFV